MIDEFDCRNDFALRFELVEPCVHKRRQAA